jgi:DNA-binding transcriptional MerR regulator
MGSHQPIRKTVAAAAPVIPDKLYFRIGDVAKLCGVAAYVLRFWETEFPQLKPNKGGTGQRLYRRKDVEMALRIKSLLYEQGYTIPGARQALRSDGAAAEPGVDAPMLSAVPNLRLRCRQRRGCALLPARTRLRREI